MIFLEYQVEGLHVPSVNGMFRPQTGFTKLGKRYTTLRKDTGVSVFQNQLKRFCLLQQKAKMTEIKFPLAVDRILTYYEFGFPKSQYSRRDLSNCIKIVEDCFLGRKKKGPLIPFDDSKVTSSLEKKVLSDKEYMIVKIALIELKEQVDDKAIIEQFLRGI